jgi:APA family basic amino acid/polyamine antiporter
MKKSLGFWRIWGLVVGSAIGTGIFYMPTLLAPYGNLTSVGWIFSGLGMLAVAMSLGSLATRVPKIGGPYAYVRKAFGDLPGFLVAWSYWISCWAALAASSVGFVGYAGVFFPALSASPTVGAVTAIGLIWLLTFLNLSGVQMAATFNLLMTGLKLLPLLIVGTAGMLMGEVTAIAPVVPEGEPYMIFLGGMFLLMVGAFVGIEAGTIPADDVVEPSKTIPRAMFFGTVTIIAIYMLSTAGIVAVLPVEVLANSSSPFSDGATMLFGSIGGSLVAIGAMISIIGVLNATVLVGGQMPLAASRDNLFPAKFAQLNGSNAPAFSLVISSVLASIMILMSFTEGVVAAYELMFLLTTLTAVLVYVFAALADLVLQWRDSHQGVSTRWQSIAVALVALIASVFAVLGSGIELLVYTAILLLCGLPVYLWLKREH